MHKTAAELRTKRKEAAEKEKQRVDKLKSENSEAYLANLYESRRIILERMQQRAKKREDITKRGSKVA